MGEVGRKGGAKRCKKREGQGEAELADRTQAFAEGLKGRQGKLRNSLFTMVIIVNLDF